MYETAGDIAMRLRPLKDRILVRLPDKKVSPPRASGIVLITTEDSDLEDTLLGTVLEVGTGHRLTDGTIQPLKFAAGDQVYLKRYVWIPVTVNNEELYLVKSDDVLAKV